MIHAWLDDGYEALSADELLEQSAQVRGWTANQVLIRGGAVMSITGLYLPFRHKYDTLPALSDDTLTGIATAHEIPVIKEQTPPSGPMQWLTENFGEPEPFQSTVRVA